MDPAIVSLCMSACELSEEGWLSGTLHLFAVMYQTTPGSADQSRTDRWLAAGLQKRPVLTCLYW